MHSVSTKRGQYHHDEDIDTLLLYWSAAVNLEDVAVASLCAVWLGVLGGEEILGDMIDIAEA